MVSQVASGGINRHALINFVLKVFAACRGPKSCGPICSRPQVRLNSSIQAHLGDELVSCPPCHRHLCFFLSYSTYQLRSRFVVQQCVPVCSCLVMHDDRHQFPFPFCSCLVLPENWRYLPCTPLHKALSVAMSALGAFLQTIGLTDSKVINYMTQTLKLEKCLGLRELLDQRRV